jgi:hypothetical protein
MNAIAHEIGHIFFGEGHPDEEAQFDKGVAPLPDTSDTDRLMCSGIRSNLESKLIVKAEWDAGLIWLRTRPKGDR